MRNTRKASHASRTLCLILSGVTLLALVDFASGSLIDKHADGERHRLRSLHGRTRSQPEDGPEILVGGGGGAVRVTGAAPDTVVELFEPSEADGDADDSLPADAGTADTLTPEIITVSGEDTTPPEIIALSSPILETPAPDSLLDDHPEDPAASSAP